jgi:hypothetical protein
VIGDGRWTDNWCIMSPPGARRVDLPRSLSSRRRVSREISMLPRGTPVVLVASAPGAIRRCASFAAAAGIDVDREFLAFPSARAPAYLVEDSPRTIQLFAQTALAPPPRARFTLPAAAAFNVLRRMSTSWPMRRLAPGRVVTGTHR